MEMWCVVGSHNYMSHICAKGFLDSDFNYAVFDRISIFQKLPQISHIHKNRNFSRIFVTF